MQMSGSLDQNQKIGKEEKTSIQFGEIMTWVSKVKQGTMYHH